MDNIRLQIIMALNPLPIPLSIPITFHHPPHVKTNEFVTPSNALIFPINGFESP